MAECRRVVTVPAARSEKQLTFASLLERDGDFLDAVLHNGVDDWRLLLVCRRVCRALREAVNNDATWRPHYEAAVSHKVHIPPCIRRLIDPATAGSAGAAAATRAAARLLARGCIRGLHERPQQGRWFEAFYAAAFMEGGRTQITEEELCELILHYRMQDSWEVSDAARAEKDPWFVGEEPRRYRHRRDGVVERSIHTVSQPPHDMWVRAGWWQFTEIEGCEGCKGRPGSQFVAIYAAHAAMPALMHVRRRPHWGWVLCGVASFVSSARFPPRGGQADGQLTHDAGDVDLAPDLRSLVMSAEVQLFKAQRAKSGMIPPGLQAFQGFQGARDLGRGPDGE